MPRKAARSLTVEAISGAERETELEGAPSRPCACCGKMFFPTTLRRLLCKLCFRKPEYPADRAGRPDDQLAGHFYWFPVSSPDRAHTKSKRPRRVAV